MLSSAEHEIFFITSGPELEFIHVVKVLQINTIFRKRKLDKSVFFLHHKMELGTKTFREFQPSWPEPSLLITITIYTKNAGLGS